MADFGIIKTVQALINSGEGILFGGLIGIIIYALLNKFFNEEVGGFTPICVVSIVICCLLVFLSQFFDAFLWVENGILLIVSACVGISLGALAGHILWFLLCFIFKLNDQISDVTYKICRILGAMAGAVVMFLII